MGSSDCDGIELFGLGGLRAACSTMLSERAPAPPRFIGHRTWMSRTGLKPKRFGIRG